MTRTPTVKPEDPDSLLTLHKSVKSVFIDPQGTFWIKYKRNSKIIWHHILDIDTAVWQCFHILEGYLGMYVDYGTKRNVIPGELNTMRQLTGSILRISQEYLGENLFVASDVAGVQKQIEEARRALGAVTNCYKQSASAHLENSVVPPSEDPIAKAGFAGKALPAASDLSKRISEILSISRSIESRLRHLHTKHRLCVRILSDNYRILADIYRQDKDLPMEEWPASDIARLHAMFDITKANAYSGLQRVDVQPYRSRARSPEIRRLSKIPYYLDKKQYGSVRNTIIGALKKLERVMAEVDERFSPRLSSLPKPK